MARYLFNGVARDGSGNVVTSATCKVFLAGTTTAASVYAASAGGVAVNSVTSGTDGAFYFYIDDADYYQSRMFKVRIEKTGYTTKDYDSLAIFPTDPLTIIAALPADSVGSNGNYRIYESGADHYFIWKAGGKWYKVQGTAVT